MEKFYFEILSLALFIIPNHYLEFEFLNLTISRFTIFLFYILGDLLICRRNSADYRNKNSHIIGNRNLRTMGNNNNNNASHLYCGQKCKTNP